MRLISFAGEGKLTKKVLSGQASNNGAAQTGK